jgi:selenocysteine lyase/cysteine desulfurase
VIFLSSTSRCLDVAIKSINWKSGDNIVFSDTEFLTTEFTGALLRQQGITVKVVQSDRGYLTPEDYDREIDSRTRLVVASYVSYKTGLILDVEGVSRVTRAKGALFFLDGIQGLGSVETNAKFADFFASGTFKWLFGMHGVSIFYVNPEILDRLVVPYVGYHSVTHMFTPNRTSEFELWPDARRFQEGLPNYAGICLLRSSLIAIQEVGVEQIFQKNRSLMRTLISELEKLGVYPFGYDMPDRHSPIVAFETEDFERIGSSLIDSGIIIWAKEGRVRISPHFYNSEADILTFSSALRDLL